MEEKSKKHDYDTRDLSCRFALDTLLRKYGFQIHERPKNSPPIWRKGHMVLTQEDACLHIPDEEYEDAKYAEELFLGGWNE